MFIRKKINYAAKIIFTKETGAIKYMATEDEKTEHDPEWENRILCPDGNCIGVIGPDGRCKECGMPYGDTGATAEKAGTTGEAPASQAHGGNPDQETDPEWENRKLCPDGNCIGVIGPDGRCKECGREA